MENNYILILIGVAAIFAIALIVMAISLSSLRKELSQNLSQNAMQIDNRMENMRDTLDKRLDVVDKRMDAMRLDNNQQLDRMRQTVDEKLQKTLDERLDRSFTSVRDSLNKVYQGLGEMQSLAVGVGDLKKVLSNVKTRGIVGEIQLGAILEQILAPDQYLENVSTIPGASERVEYAVKMPGDGGEPVLLPIDAKFPGDAYSHLMDAYDTGNVEIINEARKFLATALKKAAKDIHDKYIQTPFTTDFGVMFLPFEGLYAEAVNMGMMEEVQREYKVMIAGPSTTAALLNSLQMGFKTLAIQKNAGEVWKVLGTVKTEFDKFADVLSATQNRLDQANKELDKLVGTRTRQIQRALKGVQSLNSTSINELDFNEDTEE